MALYRCTQRPFPGIHVVSPICNVYVSFDQDGRLDTVEAGRTAGVPHELIEQAVEAMPAFTARKPTIVREDKSDENDI